MKSPESECKFCVVLTPEQRTQLSTPSYRLQKEKREAKQLESTPSKDSTLVDPSSVAVIGPVSDTATASSPPPVVPEKKVKKDKPSSSKSKKSDKSVEDSKYYELDKKWTDCFNILEALLMAKSLQPTDQPTFSASVRVPPSHSPPVAVSKDSEPFFQPISTGHTGTNCSVLVHQSANQPRSDVSPSAKRTGKDISASQHLSSSQLVSDPQTVRSSSPKRTGTDSSAKHQSASQLKSDRHRPRSRSPGRTGKDSSVSVQQSSSQPRSDRNRPTAQAGTDPSAPRNSSASKVQSDRPKSSLATDTGSPTLYRQRRDSSSSASSASGSDYSDRPP